MSSSASRRRGGAGRRRPARTGRLPGVRSPPRRLLLSELAASPLLGVTLACCLALFTTTQSLLENRTVDIAFTSNRDSGAEVYVLSRNGLFTSVRRLYVSPYYGCCPAGSPDGTRIVFMSHRDGNPELYLTVADRADGSAQARLTNHPADDFEPVWRP